MRYTFRDNDGVEFADEEHGTESAPVRAQELQGIWDAPVWYGPTKTAQEDGLTLAQPTPFYLDESDLGCELGGGWDQLVDWCRLLAGEAGNHWDIIPCTTPHNLRHDRPQPKVEAFTKAWELLNEMHGTKEEEDA